MSFFQNAPILAVFLISIISVFPFILALLFLKHKTKKRLLEIKQSLEGVELLGATDRATWFGLKSKGKGQVRGTGVLYLTKDELVFEMILPKRRVTIQTDSIRAIETPRMFLGKSLLKPLLVVWFHSEQGYMDQACWLVSPLESWTQSLQAFVDPNR